MPNPQTKEFALKHRFAVRGAFEAEQATPLNYATMLPLFFADQAKTEALAQGVQVNRANDSYEGVVTTPACYMNSRVNKIKITEYIKISGPYDQVDLIFHKAILSFNFSDVDIKDPAGVTLISKLKMTKAADTLHPTWNGTDVTGTANLHADVDGLTAGVWEHVSLYPSDLRNHREGSLGPSVRKVMIGPILNAIHKDRPYFRERWYDVPGNVKRMNAFAGCYLYIGLNAAAAGGSAENDMTYAFAADLTAEENSLETHFQVEFNEYNDSFDQVA